MRLLKERFRVAEEFVGGFSAVLHGQLLREIARRAVCEDLAAHVNVSAHGGIARNSAQQGGLAIALLADEGDALARVGGEGEVLHEVGEVLAVSEGEVLDLQHGNSFSSSKS